MAEIDGGGLSFTSELDNSQLESAIEETLRRVQGLSDGFVNVGDTVDQTVAQITQKLSEIGEESETEQTIINNLKADWEKLNQLAKQEWSKNGESAKLKDIRERQQHIRGEITVREQLVKELNEQSNKLEECRKSLLDEKKAADDNEKSQTSLRTRMRELKYELVELEAAGKRNTAQYREVRAEFAKLTDALGDAQAQASILANDDAGFAGVMSGLTGLAGGFSAVAGMAGLFGDESEDLQQVMLKTQQIMAVTNGLMQVSQALNKDSAFMLGVVGRLREWWNNLLEVGRTAQIADNAALEENTVEQEKNTVAKELNATAEKTSTIANKQNVIAKGQETVATNTNTVAQNTNTAAVGAQTAAAKAGTTANIGLAGAFRMLGAAIKSIPVFGWIITIISGLITAYSYFSSKAKEAKKAQEEFSKSLVEGCYKPIGKIEELSAKWNALGDDMEAKKKFIRDNKQAFDELGASIKTVADAENVLEKGKQKFIDAQVEKAKALVYIELAMAKVKEAVQKHLDAENAELNWFESLTVHGAGAAKKLEVKQGKIEEEAKDIETKVREYFTKAQEAEKKGAQILKDAGIEANGIVAGSLGEINQKIAEKRQELSDAKNLSEYTKIIDQIKELQKQADAITGGESNTPKSSDPFLDKLNERKAEYQRFMKWINSGDAELAELSKNEFAGLLKQGATYLDYLKKQRDQILSIDVNSRTKQQEKQLRTLSNAIAEETKTTVLEQFDQDLNAQISKAESVFDVLAEIERKRKELSNDGTELDNGKKDILDNAEKDARAKAQEQIKGLLDEYASYADKRRKIEEQFNRDIELLNHARAKATTDSERESVDAAIANRQLQFEKDTKGTGNTDYDAMLDAYGTFEQRKQAIIDEYEKKRKIARDMGDEQMLANLDKAQSKAISTLATEELTNSEVWAQLFNNLDEMSASEIEKLVNIIEANFDNLSVSFNPADLAKIREQLESAKDVLMKDNPFKQLGKAIQEVFKGASDESGTSADQIKRNWQKLGEATEKSFQFVQDAIDSCEPLKDVIGDVGQTALTSLSSVAMASIAVGEAVKTVEKSSAILAIVQGALVAVQAVFSLFNMGDRAAEKRIKKHEEAITKLQNSYKQLEWQISKSLGGDAYKNQQEAIKNMEAQKEHLYKILEEEEKKKKTDPAKVAEIKEQIAEIDRSIVDMYDDISADILQTTAKDFASNLANSLVGAFEKGEDAAKAFETTVNDVLKNAIVNQLKQKFLEKQLQGALDDLMKSMGHQEGDNFVFDGLTDAEIARFKATAQAAANNFNQAMGIYSDLFKDITGDENSDTSLTGAVKGVSEETASLVAGQMNAIRINQLEIKDALRQQLLVLNAIATNTSYNVHLAKIDRIISILENNNGNSLRSQGLTA